MTKNKRYLWLLLIPLVSLFLFAAPVLAQVNVGVNEIGNDINLSATNPLTVAARIINIFLLILGIVAVGLIILAGFKWMTSGGNEEKIDSAKRILKGAIIGLAIVLASWGIVSFIFSQLINNITGGNNNTSSLRTGVGSGFGAIGSCTVEAVYPEPEQKDVPRNSAIMVTFKEEIKLETICVDASDNPCACDGGSCNKINSNNILIYETAVGEDPTTNLKNVNVEVDALHQSFVFVPQTYLGNDVANVGYTVNLTNDIQNSQGDPIFSTCSADYLKWQFEVNNQLDLTPPQVVSAGVFPLPDNSKDTSQTVSALTAAVGSITVVGAVDTQISPSINSVAKNPVGGSWNSLSASIDPNYHGNGGIFTATITANGKIQLFDSSNNSLGIFDVGTNGQITFTGLFSTVIEGDHSWQIGNSWKISLNGEVNADTLTIAGDVYTFTTSASAGYGIQRISGNDQQAHEIELVLSGRPDILVSRVSNKVIIESKVKGSSGNSIGLETNNSNNFTIVPMAGGQDEVVNIIVNGKKDAPMNSIIQINFSEPINPTRVVGRTGTVNGIVIHNIAAAWTNTACTLDKDCTSGKCTNNVCVGNYVDGYFTVSNGYKTVEFRSANECGLNSCGDIMYCLPANSRLMVRILPAALQACNSDDDCTNKSPYNSCQTSDVGLIGGRNYTLGYKVCRDANGKNYPTAAATSTYSLMDTAFNSFDGNRDGNANSVQYAVVYYQDPALTTLLPPGQTSPYSGHSSLYYNQNSPNVNYKDIYAWSFWVTDKIDATPPQITSVVPSFNATSTNLIDPIKITFDKLMRGDTLRTGSTQIANGTTTSEHKLINLRSTGLADFGYWVGNENLDTDLDGDPDATVATINHSPFIEAVNYSSQIGSGVTDIYQNCFKPSSGLNCATDVNNPSCCNGTPTANLTAEGNCP